MSENFDLEPTLARLESDSLSEQAAALDEATFILIEFGKRVVNQFVHTNDRFIIWERLFRFGMFVIEPLKEVLLSTDDLELRGMSAMVLLKLGDKTGVPFLLEIIATGDMLLCQAAYRLAEAQITEAGDRMIERLRLLKFTEKYQKDYIQCLLIALQRLGKTLPPDLVERFLGIEAPWEIRVLLEKLV
jgi:hypothetical protein